MTFEQWFEKEHGVLDIYDFDSRGAAEHWYNQIKTAFKAGYKAKEPEPWRNPYESNYLNLDDGYQ